MQCDRCYFDNPAGARLCEYCGAVLGADAASQDVGKAATKRRTQLGPAPDPVRPPEPPAPAPATPVAGRVDPDDPFRLAALGVRAAATTPPPPDLRAGAVAPPSQAPEAPGVRPSRRATVVEDARVEHSTEVVGVALIFPPDGGVRAETLHEGRIRFGRGPDCDVVLDDPRASGDHAILRIERGSAWLLDTSTNGTEVGGQLVVNDKVDVGDETVLGMGRTRIVLKLLTEETLALLRTED